MNLVDTHCHLDLYPDMTKEMDSNEQQKIYTIAVTTTPRAWPHVKEMTKKHHYIRGALGLHPQLVSEHADEILLWEKFARETPYIGEIGLDGGKCYKESLPEQIRIFERILQTCSALGKKLLTIHSAYTSSKVIDMIEVHKLNQNCRTILHWFTGSLKETTRALDIGCYFSLNSKMLKSDRGISLIKFLPIDRILTETDRPFTIDLKSPEQSPDQLLLSIIDGISFQKSLTSNNTANAIYNNFRQIINEIQ